MIDVHNTFTEADLEAQKPALPEKVQWGNIETKVVTQDVGLWRSWERA